MLMANVSTYLVEIGQLRTEMPSSEKEPRQNEEPWNQKREHQEAKATRAHAHHGCEEEYAQDAKADDEATSPTPRDQEGVCVSVARCEVASDLLLQQHDIRVNSREHLIRRWYSLEDYCALVRDVSRKHELKNEQLPRARMKCCRVFIPRRTRN